MKKRSFKPGYEFMFSLCILAILGLPPLVSAQNSKDLQITINNGDTTVNGKNIKKLSAADRKEALSDIRHIYESSAAVVPYGQNGPQLTVARRYQGMNYAPAAVADSITYNPMANNTARYKNRVQVYQLRPRTDSSVAYSISGNGDMQHRVDMKFHFRRDEDGRMEFNRKNTQNFMYSSTDNNGIITHVNFHVSDHFGPLDPKDTKDEKEQMEMLELQDLTIVPEFAAGKTVVMFSLASKAAAEVKFKDSNGTTLWAEKAVNGTFTKSFGLGLNGIYYLQVKQAGKVIVKKILKD